MCVCIRIRRFLTPCAVDAPLELLSLLLTGRTRPASENLLLNTLTEGVSAPKLTSSRSRRGS